MKTIKEIKEIVREKELIMPKVTGNRTGYPNPIIGYAILHFINYDEIKDFQKKYGGHICLFYWEDDWQCVTIQDDTIRGPLNMLEMEAKYKRNDVICTNKEDLKKYIKNREDLEELLNDTDFDKEYVVITNPKGEYGYYSLPLIDIDYTCDNHHYEIGIYFPDKTEDTEIE